MPINGRDSARNIEIDVQRPITSKTFNPLLTVKFRRDGARSRQNAISSLTSFGAWREHVTTKEIISRSDFCVILGDRKYRRERREKREIDVVRVLRESVRI